MAVERKQTHQGKNDDSSWARGQAWLYMDIPLVSAKQMIVSFLNFATTVADMIMDRVKQTTLFLIGIKDAPVTKETHVMYLLLSLLPQ